MPALLAGFCDFLRQMLRCPLHVQVILFVDDKTVSKGMVKYATAIPRESMVDVSGEVHVPETPVAGCTCSKASLCTHQLTKRGLNSHHILRNNLIRQKLL